MDSSDQTPMKRLERLYTTYNAELFRFIYGKTGDRDKAIDILHDTFLKVHHYIQSGNAIVHDRGFIYQIARNKIIDEYRSIKAHSLEQMNLESDTFSESETITDDADSKINSELLYKCINMIPEQYREPLILRHLDGLTVSEIAKLLDTTPNTISIRIHRGLESLRERIESIEQKTFAMLSPNELEHR